MNELVKLTNEFTGSEIAQFEFGKNLERQIERMTFNLENAGQGVQMMEDGTIKMTVAFNGATESIKGFERVTETTEKSLTELVQAAIDAKKILSAKTDVLLSIPPAVKPAVLSISQMTDILLSMEPVLEDVEKNVDKMAMTMKDAKLRGINALEDGLVGLVTGAKSAKDAFRDMAKSIINDLARIAIQQMFTTRWRSLWDSCRHPCRGAR